MSTPLTPIPRPAAQRYKDLRLRHVPVVVYLLALVAVVFLWNTRWMPASFTGEVQAPKANVASVADGILVELAVERFDHVVKGQVLGRVSASPELIDVNFAAIQADLQVMRARMGQDQERNHQGYERLRLDLMDQQVELSVARANLRFAESEFTRLESLRAKGITSDSEYELALAQRDALVEEVRERAELVAQVKQALAGMDPSASGGPDAMILDSIESAIQAEENMLRTSGDLVLRAPIDGMVTKIYRNPNENVMGGEVLIDISAETSESILGYIRQPVSFVPEVGDTVIVRSHRGSQRNAAEARITKVGGRLEYFAQPLRVRGFDSSQERGLPVMISVPQELALFPGEIVDLSMKY